MKTRIKNIAPWILAGLCAAGCSAKTYSEDSRTSWLARCNEDTECSSGLTCACGVCTVACSSNAECTLDDNAVCRTGGSTSDSCSESEETQKFCALSCSAEIPCPSSLTCTDGLCRAVVQPPLLEGDADAALSSSPDADAAFSEDARVRSPDAQISPSSGDAQVSAPIPSIVPSTSVSSEVDDAGAPDAIVPPVSPVSSIQVDLDAGPDATGQCHVGYDAGSVCTVYCSSETPDVVCLMDVPEVSDLAWIDGSLWLATWGTQDVLGNHRGDGAVSKWSLDNGLETVVGGQFGPTALTGDGTRVVWATSQSPDGLLGDIWTAALDGSGPDRPLQTLVVDAPRDQFPGLLLRDDHLLFTSEHRLNLLTLGADEIEQLAEEAQAFTLGDAEDFFWSDSTGVYHRSIDAEAGEEELLYDSWAESLLVDGDLLYFTEFNLHNVPTNGGRVINMSSEIAPRVWAAAGGWVYWTARGGVIGRTRTDGSNDAESLGQFSQKEVTDFVLGADAAYILQGGRVRRVPLTDI